MAEAYVRKYQHKYPTPTSEREKLRKISLQLFGVISSDDDDNEFTEKKSNSKANELRIKNHESPTITKMIKCKKCGELTSVKKHDEFQCALIIHQRRLKKHTRNKKIIKKSAVDIYITSNNGISKNKEVINEDV